MPMKSPPHLGGFVRREVLEQPGQPLLDAHLHTDALHFDRFAGVQQLRPNTMW